jgi:hypothetical protein
MNIFKPLQVLFSVQCSNIVANEYTNMFTFQFLFVFAPLGIGLYYSLM